MRPMSAPAACFVERKHAEKVLESAAKAIGTVVLFRVAITELAGGGKEHMFACLDVDAAVIQVPSPVSWISWERRFLPEGREELRNSARPVWWMLAAAAWTFTHELGGKSGWESHCDDGQCGKECDFFHGAGKHPKEPSRPSLEHPHS